MKDLELGPRRRLDLRMSYLVWSALAAAAASSWFWLGARPQSDPKPVAVSASLPAAARASSAVETAAPSMEAVAPDPSWTRLSVSQRRALAPLERMWPTMQDRARRRWLAIASRFQTVPRAMQEQMHAKMVEWSMLSPTQRAEARLRFLQATRVGAATKRERWEAYTKADAEHVRHSAAVQPRVIPPVLVEPGPGATTVLMPRLLGSSRIEGENSH